MSSYVERRLAEAKKEGELLGLSKKRYQWVVREKSRHGKMIWYFRRGKGERVRLPDPAIVGATAFNQAYREASVGQKIGVPRPGRHLPKPNEKGGAVYFLRTGDTVKIGFSTNIRARLSSIQTSLAESPELLLTIPGTSQTERYFQHHFSSYRVRGEWFQLEGELAAFLARGKAA